MISLVTIGGTGDAYLVCSLYEAFRRHHHRDEVQVIGKSNYAAIADLFRVPYICDDGVVHRAQNDISMQQMYENVLLSDVMPFYVHPCFLRSAIRVDRLTVKPDASQADMYRMILQLPTDAPLAVPELPAFQTEPNTVLMIPDAVSWPNTQPMFWKVLAHALAASGWNVIMNQPDWALRDLLRKAGSMEWVIGPQCGVMSILVTGRFPCRKTLASAQLNDENKKLSFLSPRTFPYAYVTKFSNLDYDVEEYEITDTNYGELVDAIVHGFNGGRSRPHDPRPVLTIQAPLAPGDFLDRFAILTVKRQRFTGAKRAAVEREYRRYSDLMKDIPPSPKVTELFDRLVRLHEISFDALEHLVPAALDGGQMSAETHIAAIRLNKQRVGLKQELDAICRGPYSEVKSYHG